MKLPLTQGFYQARGLIADAQRCLNLYPEINPDDAPFPVTCQLTPGLTVLSDAADGEVWGLYRTSLGTLYAMIGEALYAVAEDYTLTQIATIGPTEPVCMCDNGLIMIVLRGANCYAVNLTTPGYVVNATSLLPDSAGYLGARKVDYIDGYFVFNRNDTQQWYISLPDVDYAMALGGPIIDGNFVGGSGYTNGTYDIELTGGYGNGATAQIVVTGGVVTSVTLGDPGQSYRVGDVLGWADGTSGSGFAYTVSEVGSSIFDPLDIAAKVGGADNLQTLIVMHREVWLLGELTSEVWYNSGAVDFTFQAVTGVFIEHGCAAPYSVAKADLSIFWLSQDLQGRAMVMTGNQYAAKRISTHALENELASYDVINDAIGFTYQQEGHVFYQLTFPTVSRTWVYDMATGLWHERAWLDEDGLEKRHRANCCAFAFGKNIVGDFENGDLYAFDLNNYTDAGDPIVRRRGFPHLLNESRRVVYRQFIAQMQVGTSTGTTPATEPTVSLRWSDTGGASWSDPIQGGLGASGEYLRSIQFQRLGMARDRVFELFWSAPTQTALNGAFVDVIPAAT